MQYLIFQSNHFYVLGPKKTKNLNVIGREISRQKRFNISSVGYVPLESNTVLPLQIEVHFEVDWLGHHSFIEINGYWWLESERGLVKSSKRTLPLIAKHLNATIDLIRFRSTRTSWCSSIPYPPPSFEALIPLFVPPFSRTFFSP